MKKLFMVLMAFVFVVASCNNNKTGKNQETDNKDKDDYSKKNTGDNDDEDKTNENSRNTGWTENDKSSSLKDCLGSFDESDAALANQICPCVLEKMVKEYASLSEAESKGGDAAAQRLALACKNEIVGDGDNTNNNTATGWPQLERDAFITNCVSTSMAKGRSRSVSQNYCDCMLNKMESLIPDIKEVANLTQEDLQSPAMKKMMNDCLNNN